MQAFIFDCFGVLVGTGFWNVYKQLGGDLLADADFINNWLNKTNLAHSSPTEMAQAMANKLGVDIEAYHEAFRKDELPNEEVFEFIKSHLKPKGIKLALVSNATGDSVRRKIPPDKLALFDAVLLSGEVGLLKPDPTLFSLALQRLGAAAEETVFVDDHQAYVDGANKVGLHTILYRDFAEFSQKAQHYLNKTHLAA